MESQASEPQVAVLLAAEMAQKQKSGLNLVL
jgi:hypothetical protein